MRAIVGLAVMSLLAGVALAADQTILGKHLVVKDPQPGLDATKRKLFGLGLETNSPNTVVGDPTVAGATLTVFPDGTTASSQTYTLPAGLWAPVPGGFKYKDPQLTQGAVMMAAIKLVKGTFTLKARVLGKTGGITVVPPNQGSEACLLLEIPDADPITGDPERYHVRFPPAPSSTIRKNDDTAFVIKDATTQGVCPQACSPGAPGCGWSDGDLTTYNEVEWGTPGNDAATLLQNHFAGVYASTGGSMEVGIAGTGGFSILLSGASKVLDYLPASGVPGPLTSDYLDPVSTPEAGIFGGEVVALKLIVDFADVGLLPGTAGVTFGDLTLCGLVVPDGTSIRQLLAIANTLLGGLSEPYSLGDIELIVKNIDGAFFHGSPSTYAQDHLVNGACP